MAFITIKRGDPRPSVSRGRVAPGAAFKVKDGQNTYVAVGRNGKLLSLNTSTNSLASTKKASSTVNIVGKAEIKQAPSWRERTAKRSQVKPGELFRTANGTKVYGALGKIGGGKFVSMDMAKGFSDDYAVSDNGDKNVVIVGTFGVDVKLL